MKKISTLLSLAITILATGCFPGNQVPAPDQPQSEQNSAESEYQRITLADLADEAADSPKWQQFFEERAAAACWQKLQSDDVTILYFHLQDDLDQTDVANEVGAGIVRYLAQYKNDQVEALAIPGGRNLNKKLTSLDPAIGQLTNLKHLDLDGNRLQTLPEAIGQLTNLQGLELKDNGLTRLSEKLLPWWQQIDDPVAPENPWLKQEDLGEPIALDSLAAEAKDSRSKAWSNLPSFLIQNKNKPLRRKRRKPEYENKWRALQLLDGDAQKKISQWRGGQGIVFFEDGIPFYLDRQLFTDEDVQAMCHDLAGKQLYRFWSLRR